jgi:hypothetical protein
VGGRGLAPATHNALTWGSTTVTALKCGRVGSGPGNGEVSAADNLDSPEVKKVFG